MGAATVNLTDTTGTVQFDGAAATDLNTAAQDYGVSLLGGSTIANAVTILNTGILRLGDDSSDVNTFTGGIFATAATPPSSITQHGNLLSSGNIALDATTTIDFDGTIGATTSIGGDLRTVKDQRNTTTANVDLADAISVDGLISITGTGECIGWRSNIGGCKYCG